MNLDDMLVDLAEEDTSTAAAIASLEAEREELDARQGEIDNELSRLYKKAGRLKDVTKNIRSLSEVMG